MHPKATPENPFDEIHIDFIDKKSERSNRNHISILTMICAFSRYAFAFPMKRFTINPVIGKIVELCGILGKQPRVIYADNAFCQNELKQFCSNENIQLKLRASHLSRSVMVERFHRSFHEKMKSFLSQNSPKNWDLFTAKATSSLNKQVHDSTGFTPFYLFYGQNDENSNLYADTVYRDCKNLARLNSDGNKKSYTDTTYIFPKLEKNDSILIRYDPCKNGRYFKATVLSDDGKAELMVKLENRKVPIRVHKGHVYAEKGTSAYSKCF